MILPHITNCKLKVILQCILNRYFELLQQMFFCCTVMRLILGEFNLNLTKSTDTERSLG